MVSKFVLRFDDVAPEMAWSKFGELESALIRYGIRPVVGVVPDCQDTEIMVEPCNDLFWDRVRHWQTSGWTIAQHGYTHLYETNDSGVLSINDNSEFSGLPYEVQLRKLNSGKTILEREGVWQPVFMAPAHSFDRTTLIALENLGFQYLTDGYGLYPYKMAGLTAVPQLFSRPLHFGFGVYTICVHVNNMGLTQLAELVGFVRKNANRFIPFEDAVRVQCAVPLIDGLTRAVLATCIPGIRAARRLL